MGRKWTDEERKARSIAFSTPPLCPRCGETDPTAFYIHKKNGRRANAYCAKCHKENCKKRYYSKTILLRRASRASIYGLTSQQYLDMYNNQNGKCAICQKSPITKRGLHIDHCHKSGVVRGLLCHGCNIGIGNFMHDVKLMNKAIKYLGG
jgi:hypothetical protein